MRILLAFLACLHAAGCTFGPHLNDLQPANGGAGATVRVNRSTGGSMSGELIGWNAEGLLLRILSAPEDVSLYVVPEREIRSIEIAGLGKFNGSAARLGLNGATRGARYSRRIDDALLARLLEAHGQTELMRPR
jgi:hypothetical protein